MVGANWSLGNEPASRYGNAMIQKVQADLVGQFALAVKGTAGIESEILKTIGILFADGAFVRQQGGKIRAEHEYIGEAAQRSMVAAYTHRRFRRPPGSYRLDDPSPNERYAGGALRRALLNPGMVEATERGLSFINTDILNNEARQWRRLNYGAGSKAGTAPAQFPVEWGGVVAATLGLPADPRPAFRIPKGYWVGPDGERVGAGKGRDDRFYPTSTKSGDISRAQTFRGRPSPGRMTAGIAAANFLDAGVRRIANELPSAYLRLYSDWYENNLARIEGIAENAGQTLAPVNEVQYVVEYTRDKNRPRVVAIVN